MKKQWILMVVMAVLLMLAVVGCQTATNDEMKSDTMSQETTAKEDEMKDDEMKDDEMKDDEMKDDEMKEDSGETMMGNSGKNAKAFDLKDLDGNAISLASLEGEKVYVKFWASWCSICLAGMDELDMLAAEENDFRVLTIVSPDFSGEMSAADFTEWFKGLQKDNITVLLDEGGDVARAYGVRGYPTSVYIGSDGILIKQIPGHFSNDRIKETFEGIY